ncbi:MAG: hypothetical protein U0235_29940 [Polyangiaceae bacterium]
MGRRVASGFAALATVWLTAAPAHALDAVQCAATAERAQSLRQANKLTEAARELVACANAECPKFVRADCVRWLDEVQSTLPSVVVRAETESGADVLDAQVSVDDVTASLGLAVSLDPGTHVVRVRKDGALGEAKILVAQGEKNRVVVVRVAAPKPANGDGGGGEAPTTSGGGRGPWPFVLGGIGAVGLVTFGVLQVAAQNEYDKLHDRCAPSCDPSEVDSVRTKVTFSAVALGVGVVGVGAGVALWFATEPDKPKNVGLVARPTSGGAATELRVRF